MRNKDYSELDLTSNFIFAKVMTNPELCRELLEMVLGIEIERITYLEKEKVIDEKHDAKGIRLDVYVKDARGTVYNVEMQTTDPGNLPKRSRYYQGLIDLNVIAKGEDYKKLNKSFVIFICMSDIFGKGRHIYTFENRCIQDTDITLEDETVKIFLNPYSEMDDVIPELANFLKFLTDGRPVDEFTERLVEAVETARNNKMWELEYKAFYADRQDVHREGFAEGLEAGLFAMVKILKPMLKDFDKVYDAVTGAEEYANVTRDEVMKCYQMCP